MTVVLVTVIVMMIPTVSVVMTQRMKSRMVLYVSAHNFEFHG